MWYAFQLEHTCSATSISKIVTLHSYTMKANLNVQEVSSDNQSNYKIPYNFEKSYALPAENSIKFENKFFSQADSGKEYILVEAAFLNSMKDKVYIKDFQVLEKDYVKKVEVLAMNSQEQEVAKRSTFKFVIRYEIQAPPDVQVTDLGRVQFNWYSERAEVDGGTLAYHIKSPLDKKVMDFQIEYIAGKPLKKNELVEVDLAFTSL